MRAYENFIACCILLHAWHPPCNRRVHPDRSAHANSYDRYRRHPDRNPDCCSYSSAHDSGSQYRQRSPPPFPSRRLSGIRSSLFTISAPNGYAGTTIRAPTSAYNILYKTTIFNPAVSGANRTITDNSGTYIELPDSLTIFSYSSSLSVDQNIRNIIRGSGAAFTESVVTYNGITYVRFDVERDPYSGAPGKTIVFVGNKASANEKGYPSGYDLHADLRRYPQPGNV